MRAEASSKDVVDVNYWLWSYHSLWWNLHESIHNLFYLPAVLFNGKHFVQQLFIYTTMFIEYRHNTLQYQYYSQVLGYLSITIFTFIVLINIFSFFLYVQGFINKIMLISLLHEDLGVNV